MSTRSQIITIENGKPIGCYYHHYDGYIEDGVGEELLDAMADDGFRGVMDMIGNDSGYEDEISVELSEKGITVADLPKHGDIEFLYFVDADEMAVKVIKFRGWPSNDDAWDYHSEYAKKNLRKLVKEDGVINCVPCT